MTRACPGHPRAGKIPRSVLRILVHAESVMFMAIAVALVVIAVVVFARGGHDLVLAPRGEQFAVTITPGGQQLAGTPSRPVHRRSGRAAHAVRGVASRSPAPAAPPALWPASRLRRSIVFAVSMERIPRPV